MDITEYGFYGRLAESFPSQFIIDVTEVCNLGCTHCPHPTFRGSEHYTKAYLDPDLNKKLIDEVKLHGKGITQYVRYTSNGEPLIHPKIFEMLGYAARQSGTTVTLTTNGKILNETRINKLLETGIHLVDISLDALMPETYAKIRVGGDLEVTRQNVLNLIQKKNDCNSDLLVVVSYVEQPDNIHETVGFEEYWKTQGADYVVIRKLHSAAGCKPDVAEEMWNQIGGEKRRPCVYPWERIVLGPTGKLAFCPADWTHGSRLSDYRETTIVEEWQGEYYKELRRAHLKNDYTKHRFCGQCPDWKVTQWPGKGRAYADMVEDFKRDGAIVMNQESSV